MYKLISFVCVWLSFAVQLYSHPQPRTEREVILAQSG